VSDSDIDAMTDELEAVIRVRDTRPGLAVDLGEAVLGRMRAAGVPPQDIWTSLRVAEDRVTYGGADFEADLEAGS
jgi:hypothetical protein